MCGRAAIMQEHAAHRDCLGARGLQAAWAGHRCRTASIDLARRRARADRARRPDRAVLVSPEHGAGAHVARGAGDRRQPDRDPEPHGRRGCRRHRARLDRRRRDRRHVARPPPHARARQPERDRHLARQARTRRSGWSSRPTTTPAAPRSPTATCSGQPPPGCASSSATGRPAGSPGSRSRLRGCWRTAILRIAGVSKSTVGAVQVIPTIGLVIAAPVAARPGRRRLEPRRQRQRKRRGGGDVARERARRGPTGRRGRRPGAHRSGRRRRHRPAQVSARQPPHAAAEQRRRRRHRPDRRRPAEVVGRRRSVRPVAYLGHAAPSRSADRSR